MTGFRFRYPCLNLAAPLTTFKSSCVLRGTRSNSHCRLHRHDGAHDGVWRPERFPSPPSPQSSMLTNGQCRPSLLFGPLVCLWNTQEGKEVRACRDARRTGNALGNVSPSCEHALLPSGGACLLGNRTERDGGLTTDRVCTQRDSLSRGCTRC